MKENSPDPSQDGADEAPRTEGPSPISDGLAPCTEPRTDPSSADADSCKPEPGVNVEDSLLSGNLRFPPAQEPSGNLSVPVEKYTFGRATVHVVTQELLGQIWKDYLRSLIKKEGGTRPLARKLCLPNHNRLVKIMKGVGFVSPEVLLAIAEHIGPSIGEIYFHIGAQCAKAEGKLQQYGRVQGGRASAPVPSGTEDEVRQAIQENAQDERLRPKGRPAQAGEREDVPPLGLTEEVGRQSSKRS